MNQMKKATSMFIIILLIVVAGCRGGKQSTDEFITVDVTKSYPKKELILQDFMDVEYVPLESTDSFLTQGRVLDISKKYIVVKNRWNDGDIFIFDRTTGKGLKKINRRGEGPEEYRDISEIIIDDDMDEMYVQNLAGSGRIIVYDLNGKFRRSFVHKQGLQYAFLHNFDRENLICYNYTSSVRTSMYQPTFLLLSKRDGSITKEIQIPYEKTISTGINVRVGDLGLILSADRFTITGYFDNWALSIPSSDTIYRYQPDHTITPLIIRTPSIQSMAEPKVFLFTWILTDRYYLMEAVKKEYDLAAKKMSSTDLLYDRQKNALFEYKIYNNDYADKKLISLTSPNTTTSPRLLNGEVSTWQVLEAYELVEAYQKGELKGKLKEIAAGLEAEDNPVIMLVKHKK